MQESELEVLSLFCSSYTSVGHEIAPATLAKKNLQLQSGLSWGNDLSRQAVQAATCRLATLLYVCPLLHGCIWKGRNKVAVRLTATEPRD